ncbi:hypothetical protein LPJ53_003717 [Coemansia erecta]|uniref:TOG domain-containing protein n=1 Tax=Coemansia erecta TaxID=147472 RepID=A0A9W7Y0K4_9FUNG|nr:hypothetical protein LPJ53_003717 [Coemansia erecta]
MCESASDFEAKFRVLIKKLDVVEHEETWQQIDDALKGLVSLVKAGATRFETFVPTMKQAVKFINSAALSERTRLSGTALTLFEELARMMETRITPLSDMMFPTIMKTCGRANKVFVTRGIKCLTTAITYSHLPEQTPRICDAASTDPNKTVRSSAAKLLMSIVSCCTVPELSPHLTLVEKAIASGVVDANPDARTTARQSYEIYIKRFSNRVEAFHAGLSSTARKYLKVEDKSSARPQSQFAAFRQQQQRQPLRDRPTAQPPVPLTIADPASAAVATVTIAATASEPASATSREPVLTPVAAATAAAAAPPKIVARSSSVERLIMSPQHGSKPNMTQLLTNGTQPDVAAADKPAADSAHASISPSSTAPASRVASPVEAVPSAEGSETVTDTSKPVTPPATTSSADKAADSADEQLSSQETKAAPEAKKSSKAHRTPGLSFSSLGGSTPGARNSRMQHVGRPQSRNMVSVRMEEALRAQRPAKPSSSSAVTAASDAEAEGEEGEQPRRMTLRSATRPPSGAPGYLRATASSAKRGTETAADRGLKRRKAAGDQQQDGTAAVSTALEASIPAKTSATTATSTTTTRRRSAIKR